MDRKGAIDRIKRAARSEYAGTKRDMQLGARGVRDSMQQKIADARAEGISKLTNEYKGRTPDEKRLMRKEYDARPGAVSGLTDEQYPGAMAARDYRPGIVQRAQMGVAALADANAAPGLKGDVARTATCTGGIAMLTASGAALADLTKFMMQGANVQQERDEVLPS